MSKPSAVHYRNPKIDGAACRTTTVGKLEMTDVRERVTCNGCMHTVSFRDAPHGKPWTMCGEQPCRRRAFYEIVGDVDGGTYASLPDTLADKADEKRLACTHHLTKVLDEVIKLWESACVSAVES